MLSRRRAVLSILTLLLLAASGLKASPASGPQTRSAQLQELLRRLHTTARLVQTTAHPDDEDGGMLTLASRGKGADVVLLTLTRGEGGQNKVGSNLLDVLGEVRTLELLAADDYYGVQQRFTRVADFGFSKTADETFDKWHGHDAALGDMVRVIRTFRPDVLVSRFSGTPRDGHGHHQACGILTREAFRAAADPQRFPEQIKDGLLPWQAKKLYIGVRSPDDATVALNTGEVDPLLGVSYVQYAMEGLKHQQSQGVGNWNVPAGPRFTYYKLIDSVLPMPATGAREQDFFDGIDTSVPGLASRLDKEEQTVPFLRPALLQIAGSIQKASASAAASPEAAAPSLLAAVKLANDLIARLDAARLSGAVKQDILDNLTTKRAQLERAANLALGIAQQAAAEVAPAGSPGDVFVAVPGQSFTVKVTRNSTSEVKFGNTGLDLPSGWRATPLAGSGADLRFRVDVPLDARLTRPYGHREHPESDTIYTLDQPQFATLPFAPPAFVARTEYSANGLPGVVRTPIQVSYRDFSAAVRSMPLAVAPALSVALEPSMRVLPVAVKDGTDITVSVQKNVASAVDATVRLQLPAGWRSEPASAPLNIAADQRRGTVSFHVIPGALREERAGIRAVVEYAGRSYSEGYTVVTRPDLDTSFYYQPATQRISVVDVNVPGHLKVGYIMGAGDEIPTVLQQIGMDVTIISEQELATGDLSRYGTIVLGIRAYDTRDGVRRYNQRLLDYVQAGGTLLMQYNAAVGEFNSGRYTPYQLELGRERVTVEEAPVQMLAPQAAVFHQPNQMSAKDFTGWVQERGLYFASSWDQHFEPMLESHDPGEAPLKGGLLYARYGKGLYIYTGYSFFRQLPAGVPGAIRLFVNLVSSR